MSVRLTFDCNGCDAKAEGTDRLRKRFHSFSGRGYGLGVYVIDDIETVTPEGWVAFDPYTQMTYCPECWAEIDSDAPTTTTDAGPVRPGAGPDHRCGDGRDGVVGVAGADLSGAGS